MSASSAAVNNLMPSADHVSDRCTPTWPSFRRLLPGPWPSSPAADWPPACRQWRRWRPRDVRSPMATWRHRCAVCRHCVAGRLSETERVWAAEHCKVTGFVWYLAAVLYLQCFDAVCWHAVQCGCHCCLILWNRVAVFQSVFEFHYNK